MAGEDDKKIKQEIKLPGQEAEGQPVSEVDIDVDDVTTDMEEKLNSLTAELGFLAHELVDSPELQNEAQELENNVKELKEDFLARLGKILKKPFSKLQEMKETKMTEALAIPDNPKIIKDLKERLKKLEEKIRKERNNIDDKKMGEYLSLVDTYQKATKKEDSKVWNGIDYNLSATGHKLVEQSLSKNNILGALVFFDTYNDHTLSYKGDRDSDKIVGKIMEKYSITAFKPLSEVDFSILGEKVSFLSNIDKEVSAIIGDREELIFTKEDLLRKLKEKIFSSQENIVLTWSPEKIAKVKALKPEWQKKILKDKILFGVKIDLLLDEPRLAELLDFYQTFPEVGLTDFKPEDKTVILDKIMKKWPNPEDLKKLWEKIKTNLKPGNNGFDRVDPIVLHTMLSVAERENSEQLLKRFDLQKIKALSVVELVGGDEFYQQLAGPEGDKKLAEFTTFDSGWEKTNKLMPFVKKFQTGLQNKFEGAVDSYGGWDGPLAGMFRKLTEWQEFIDKQPANFRHKLLENTPPNARIPHNYQEINPVSEEYASNFLEYNQLCPPELKLDLYFLYEENDRFSDEKWSEMKKNLQKMQPEILALFEKEKQPIWFLDIIEKHYSDRANDIVNTFNNSSSDYVRIHFDRHDFHSKYNYYKKERQADSVADIFKLAKFCQTHFGPGKEKNWEFFKRKNIVDDSELKIIQLILSDDFDLKSDLLDLKVLEGKMLFLQNKFGHSYYREMGEFADFNKMSENEKELFLKFKDFGYESKTKKIIESGKALIVLDLLNHGFKLHTNLLLKMADRMDCLGFFYYVGPYVQYGEGDDVIDKVIALNDAGLDVFYQLDNFPPYLNERRDFEERLLKWDVAKLTAVANAFVGNEKIDLQKLMWLCDQEQLSVPQLITQVNLYLATDLTDFLFGHYGQEGGNYEYLSEDRSEEYKTIISELEEALGRQMDFGERSKFFFSTKLNISKEGLNFLKTNPKILALFLKSEHHYFYDRFLSFDKELLEDERFWKSGLRIDSEIIKDLSLAKSFFEFEEKIRKSQVDSKNDYGENIKTKQDFDQEKRVEFLLDKLANYKNKNNKTDIVALIKLLEKCNNDETVAEKLLDYVYQIFATEDAYLFHEMDFVLNLNEQQKQTLLELRKVVGADLPFDFIKENLNFFVSGKTAENILTDIENDEKVKNSYKFKSWISSRRKGVMADFIEKNPEIVKQPLLAKYLDSEREIGFNNDKDLCLDIAQGLSELSLQSLKNFERFLKISSGEKYGPTLTVNVVELLKSSQAEILIKWLENRKDKTDLVDKILKVDKEKFNNFLSLLNENCLEQYNNLPEYLQIDIWDVPAFFADPIANKVTDYADKIKQLFGNKKDFHLSVYDLMLTDFEVDWQNLQTIQSEGFFGLNDQVLNGLAMEENEIGQTAQRTLALDKTSKIGSVKIETVIASLEKLTPELRQIVFDAEIDKFGIKFLTKEDEVREILGLSEKDWEELVFKVCNKNRDHINEILRDDKEINFSLGMWQKLLSKTDVLPYLVLKRYKGEPVGLWNLFLNNRPKFESLFGSVEITSLVERFKDFEEFWLLIISDYTNKIFTLWKEVPADFFKEETIDLLIEKSLNNWFNLDVIINKFLAGEIILSEKQQNIAIDGLVSNPKNNLDILKKSAGLSDTEMKKQEIMSTRIDLVVNNWPEDVDKAIAIMVNLSANDLLNSDKAIILNEIWTEINKDTEKYAEQIKILEKTFIDYVIGLDSSLKNLFADPKKLGKLKEIIIGKMLEFMRIEFGKKDLEEGKKLLLQKLREIKKIYESSDSSPIDKHALFLDKYTIKDCKDLDFRKRVESGESIELIMREDFENILVASGNEELLRYYEKKIDSLGDQESDESTILREKIKEIKETKNKADQRNRELYKKLAEKVEQGDNDGFVELLVPWETSISQVGPPQVTLPILEKGTLPDALLGSLAVDQENNLSSHISWTKKISLEKSNKLEDRLPSYGNPHGVSVNRIYADISNLRHQPHGQDGTEDSYFQMGRAHYCVEGGIASNEITAIVLSYETDLSSQQKAIAINGSFINLVDMTGKLLWSPEQFDEMKVFYYDLTRKGYPIEVIDSVYKYYKDDSLEPRHRAVMDKAYDYIKNKGKEKFDWAVLVSFLQSNDLNKNPSPEYPDPVDWYKSPYISFEEILDFIKGRTKQKVRRKAKGEIFGSVRKLNQELRPPTELSREVENEENQFVKSFLEQQLPYTFFGKDLSDLNEEEKEIFIAEKKKYERAWARLSFLNISAKETIEIAKLFSEQKKILMQRLWQDVWREVEADGQLSTDTIAEYKQLITPLMAGSGGRGEIVMGSDLDYCLYVDDNKIPIEGKDIKLAELKSFINNVLAGKMNILLTKKHIRADAGLANADRTPFTTLSEIENFSVNVSSQRQKVEPTEILDTEPLFIGDLGITEQARENLLVKNKSANLLPSFIERDLEVGGNKKAFMAEFEDLYSNVASGKMIEKIKESLQRVILFKTDALLVDNMMRDKIPKSEAKNIPAGMVDKIEFLRGHNILSEKEKNICLELFAMAYKLRFVGELYSSEAKIEDQVKKVKNVQFKVEDISYEEREKLIELLKVFKSEVLYK